MKQLGVPFFAEILVKVVTQIELASVALSVARGVAFEASNVMHVRALRAEEELALVVCNKCLGSDAVWYGMQLV